MAAAAGGVILVLALIGWGGQSIAALAPAVAIRLGLLESEDEVEPAFWADARGEAVWDGLTLWTMVVAGLMLMAGSEAWAYLVWSAACTSTAPAVGFWLG